jgi:hypothetical protein
MLPTDYNRPSQESLYNHLSTQPSTKDIDTNFLWDVSIKASTTNLLFVAEQFQMLIIKLMSANYNVTAVDINNIRTEIDRYQNSSQVDQDWISNLNNRFKLNVENFRPLVRKQIEKEARFAGVYMSERSVGR